MSRAAAFAACLCVLAAVSSDVHFGPHKAIHGTWQYYKSHPVLCAATRICKAHMFCLSIGTEVAPDTFCTVHFALFVYGLGINTVFEHLLPETLPFGPGPGFTCRLSDAEAVVTCSARRWTRCVWNGCLSRNYGEISRKIFIPRASWSNLTSRYYGICRMLHCSVIFCAPNYLPGNLSPYVLLSYNRSLVSCPSLLVISPTQPMLAKLKKNNDLKETAVHWIEKGNHTGTIQVWEFPLTGSLKPSLLLSLIQPCFPHII
jgi:hypothetical protein